MQVQQCTYMHTSVSSSGSEAAHEPAWGSPCLCGDHRRGMPSGAMLFIPVPPIVASVVRGAATGAPYLHLCTHAGDESVLLHSWSPCLRPLSPHGTAESHGILRRAAAAASPVLLQLAGALAPKATIRTIGCVIFPYVSHALTAPREATCLSGSSNASISWARGQH